MKNNKGYIATKYDECGDNMGGMWGWGEDGCMAHHCFLRAATHLRQKTSKRLLEASPM